MLKKLRSSPPILSSAAGTKHQGPLAGKRPQAERPPPEADAAPPVCLSVPTPWPLTHTFLCIK